MATNMAQLAEALRTGATAQGQMAALQDKLRSAQSMADTRIADAYNPNTGYGSPFQAIANALRADRGRKEAESIQEQMMQAGGQVAAAKNAQTLYNAQQQADATTYDRSRNAAQDLIEADNRKYERGETKSALEKARKLEEDKRKLSEKDMKGTGTTYVMPDGTTPMTIFETRKGPVDSNGNPVDVTGMLPYKDYLAKLKAAAAARKATTSGSSGGMKPTGAERKTANEAKRLSGVIADLKDMRSKMPPEALSEIDSPNVQALLSAFPDPVARLAEGAYYDAPEAREYLTRVARLESRLSQLASGLAVTGFEMSDRQKWSPNAPGISDAERERRIKNIQKDLLSEVDTFNEYYPDYAVGMDTTDAEVVDTEYPATDENGWTLQQDAAGGKAYVSPDGTQYREVE